METAAEAVIVAEEVTAVDAVVEDMTGAEVVLLLVVEVPLGVLLQVAAVVRRRVVVTVAATEVAAVTVVATVADEEEIVGLTVAEEATAGAGFEDAGEGEGENQEGM